jgi:hypothetical protein
MVRFVVLELPRSGKPITAKRIAQELQISQAQVVGILDELEKNKTFLFCDAQGAVTWAYPRKSLIFWSEEHARE